LEDVVSLLRNGKLKFKIVAVITILILITLFGVTCAPRPDFNSQVNAIVKPGRFSSARWEFNAIISEIKLSVLGKPGDEINTSTVIRYFDITKQLEGLEASQNGPTSTDPSVTETIAHLKAEQAALETATEKTIEQQIRATLTKDGIFNPFFLKFGFPPIDFKLNRPPNMLIISPRDRIVEIKSIMLLPDLSTVEMESLEAKVDNLNVSALVVPLGGLGATFPTFVNNGTDLRDALVAAVHEYLHQYLAFKPLGFRYVLDLSGISRNYDIVTINETVANMASKEIGAQIYQEYYAQHLPANLPQSITKPAFDFNAAMREIRRTVDAYLANGQAQQAEQYMEQQRQFLATKGYYIRKLNQAYFAFYGTYADSPTSVSPIGTKLAEIRNQSHSLKDFLSKVSGITSVQDLDQLLQSGKPT
jgi:hypothetical protein